MAKTNQKPKSTCSVRKFNMLRAQIQQEAIIAARGRAERDALQPAKGATLATKDK